MTIKLNVAGDSFSPADIKAMLKVLNAADIGKRDHIDRALAIRGFNINKAPCGCGCDGEAKAAPDMMTLRANLSSGARREIFLGQEHLVVPLVMLRETVVNGALVTMNELKPQGWNGVPVTIGHPNVKGSMVPANSPKVLEAWRVGHIFNAHLDGDKLKAEAWIDINLAEKNYPGIIPLLEGGTEMDVSTGYFSTDVPEVGLHEGKPYFQVHRDLKPDHLALLPDEEGACSWADGCGVRINQKEKGMSDKSDKSENVSQEELAGIARFFKAFTRQNATTNKRGADDDFRQMVADLISNDASPFVPDDEYALRDMSYDSLKALRDQYLPKTNSKGATEMAEDDKTKVTPVTAEQVTDIITNALKDTLPTMVNSAVDTALNANKRAELVAGIHEAMGIETEELERLSTNALEAMAPKAEAKAKTNAKADMSGKGLKTNGDDGDNVKRFPGMATNGKVAEDEKEA